MISLIFCGDIKYCPYLKRYTERLELKGIEYEVLFWNRDGRVIPKHKNYYYYTKISPENLRHIEKLRDFSDFRKWLINHLKKTKSDGLIMLSTLSGILLSDQIKNYRSRYIFDIRDYSFESIRFFRDIEKYIISNSYFTAISSKGFTSFLPDHDYIIAHNFDRREIIPGIRYKKPKGKISFVWNGTIRFLDFQKQYIDALANDERFHLYYHGSGQYLEAFMRYASSIKAHNISFTGPYDNNHKADLLRDASVLNNCYGGNYGDALKYAVSNRYYDGLIYRIPQLVEPGGYKASLVKKYGVGVPVLPDSGFADWLYNYITTIDIDEFENRCSIALDTVIKEDDEYIYQIDKFIEMMR